MILEGVGGSGGVLEGRAKIYSKGGSYSSDDILLAFTTTPDMGLEIVNVGAVATEVGGMLCHAAIFCREIKIPCVVGVKGLMDKIKSGTKIRIDGDKGTITII